MLVPTLRGYLSQRAQLTTLEQEVTERVLAVERLDKELQRWDDPAYVEQQARQRLKFVRPGETSYQVLDAEGLSGEALAASGSVVRPNESAGSTWYGRVWSSLDAADSLSPKDVNAPLAPIAPDAGMTTDPAPGSPASSGTGVTGTRGARGEQRTETTGRDNVDSGAGRTDSGADRTASGVARARSEADGTNSGADRTAWGAGRTGSGADGTASEADGADSGTGRTASVADGANSRADRSGSETADTSADDGRRTGGIERTSTGTP